VPAREVLAAPHVGAQEIADQAEGGFGSPNAAVRRHAVELGAPVDVLIGEVTARAPSGLTSKVFTTSPPTTGFR
jgi:hypothetical protein